MLMREGFVAADMSGQSNLQRSSWKAEAIRKGNLKISGPLPITEDMPLNEHEEKEFAETGALSPGQPQDELDQLDSQPQILPQPELPPPSIPIDRASLASHPVADGLQEVLQARQSRSPPRPPRQVTEMARDNAIEPATPSRNEFRATPDSSNASAQKKKRKSGLRGVFRKMFGRKDKDAIEEEEPTRRGHNYHHSDPGLLQQSQQSPPRETKTPGGTRISDLPVKELEPLHPLGLHLPYPMNVNAPPASPPREYLIFDADRPEIGRRRATLAGVPSAGMQRHSLDEPRARLSAWDERPDDEALPSLAIGIALSSPTQAVTPVTSKRRSRSADALRDLAKGRASTDRRRSAEIRYWRQSYASGSVYSRPQTAGTVETIRSIQRQETMITEPGDEIAEMSATISHVDEPSPLPIEEVHERDVQPPVPAFNFGLKSEFSDDDATPLEHPAPVSPAKQNRNRLSIEDRVAHLEGSFQSIESSLKRVSSRNNRQTIILADPPRNLRSRQKSSSNSQTHFDNLPNYQSSTDTLQSNPASPVLVRLQSDDVNQDQTVEKLYEVLKYERIARKALEQQVHQLQHDISDLHALVNKLITSATASSPNYPTPSPDTLMVSTEGRLVTPKSAYVHDRDKENHFTRLHSNGSLRRSDDDDWKEGTNDVWATPKEEGFSGSGFFHEGRGAYI